MTNPKFFWIFYAVFYGGLFVFFAVSWVRSSKRHREYMRRYDLSPSSESWEMSSSRRAEQRNLDLERSVNQLSYRVAYLEGLLNVQRKPFGA